MFLCLILLASTILAPSQSVLLSPAQVALHGENYSKLVVKMDEFDKQHVAPLIKTRGGCNIGMQIKDERVGVDGRHFEAIQRRCETAVVLHKAMGEIRTAHAHKNVKKMEENFTKIRRKVLLYDVLGLEGKLFSHFGNESEVYNKLRDLILHARDVGTEDHKNVEGKQRENLKNAFEKALEAFKENRSYETAYTMVYGAEETGKAMNWNDAEGMEWAMDTFKANLLVYDFLLKEEANEKQVEAKPSGHGKPEKKHSSGHHGVMEQADAMADQPETA